MNTSFRQLTVFSAYRRFPVLRRGVLLIALLCGVSGCASGLMSMTGANALGSKFAGLLKKDAPSEADKEDNDDFDTRVETPLLGDYISVTGNNMVALRGVGLVTGLNGTGGDPPPSHLRQELINEMGRRKIPNPSRILASRNTAMVIVTAYLPAMVREGQRFDVRVALPPNSEATSLKGGWLLETRLAEEQVVAGRGNLKGHQYGVAHGAILTAMGSDGKSQLNPAMLRRGSIPGGAVSKTERDLEIIIRNEYRGLKTAKRIENAISHRLHHYNRFGQRVPMAEAKTDAQIELKVHPLYRNNFPRYQQMIRSIAFRETDVAGRIRLEMLSRELLQPATAARAALQLEAIGRDSISFLKAALASPDPEVRFHAAQSLAYLEDSSGAQVLKEAARDEAAFRVYALAALSVIEDADGIVALRELLDDDVLETRYGAVRALKESNPQDSSLGTIEYPHQFVMHAIQTQGPPAVHVVRYRAPEVVIFGADQKLTVPAVLNVGNLIRVIGQAGASTVTVTKYQLDTEPESRVVSTSLVEVIQTAAALGANYPDIVQMLLEAENQHLLAGELGIDRLPQAGRVLLRTGGGSRTKSDADEAEAEDTENTDGDSDSSERSQKTRVGTPSLTPGLFDRVEDGDQDTTEEDTSALARMFALQPAETDETDETDKTDSEADPDAQEDSQKTAASKTSAKRNRDSKIRQSSFEQSDDTDTAADGDSDDGQKSDRPAAEVMEFEDMEFREPFGAKLRRTFLGPFRSEPSN